jgi:hypothetical protein
MSADPAFVVVRNQLKLAILVLACGCFGFAKWNFHPYRRGTYAEWLRTTPWTRRLRLPLGPTYLGWIDWIKLAALAALGWWDLQLDPAWIAVTFGVPYFFVGAFALAGSSKVEAAALALGLGWLILVAPNASAMAAILAVMYLIFYLGLAEYLDSLPWDEPERAAAAKLKLASSVGWPFDKLGPGRKFSKATWASVFTWAGLIAWLFYCVGTGLERLKGSDPALGAGFAGLFAFFAAMIRWAFYYDNCHPPLSLSGRVATGRWIIPGYDHIFLPPLAILASATFIILYVNVIGASPSLVLAATVGTSILIARGAGPSMSRWRLTGDYCLAGPNKKQRRGST